MRTDDCMKLVDEIYKKVDDVEPAQFLATIGTVMKMYSVEHDSDMSTMVIRLATVLLRTENEFNS